MIVGGSVKTIVERVYRLGEASEALRHLTEDRPLAKSSWPVIDKETLPPQLHASAPPLRTIIARYRVRFASPPNSVTPSRERSNPISSIPHNKASPMTASSEADRPQPTITSRTTTAQHVVAFGRSRLPRHPSHFDAWACPMTTDGL